MVRLLISLGFLAVTTPALAQLSLIHQTPDAGISTYLDTTSLKRAGNTGYAAIVTDYKELQDGDEYRFSSHKALSEFDCSSSQERVMSMTLYGGHLGQGEEVAVELDPSDPIPVTPNTINAAVYHAACGK